jgi:hypothetical protein
VSRVPVYRFSVTLAISSSMGSIYVWAVDITPADVQLEKELDIPKVAGQLGAIDFDSALPE